MKKQQPGLVVLSIICVLSLVLMIFALTRDTVVSRPEFTPPPFDSTAVAGIPTVPEGLGYSELDCQAYKVSLCGKLGADGQIWLTNPSSNSVWLKVRVMDEKGNILGETGLIRPGEYVQAVALQTVPKSGTAITLKIMAYEPETYYSAGAVALNTTVN